MGVLADHQIRRRCNGVNGMMIEPFTDSQVEPASYDVRLGSDFLVFERDETPFIDMHSPVDITKPVSVREGGHFMMHPGEFALGRTVETVNIPNDLVARIEGKSSVGRLGLMIHITAGYIDPGFRGPITLELYCVHPLPVMIYPGDKIAQLSFHEMSSTPSQAYNGRYQDASSVEASKFGAPVTIGKAWHE
jgi:dCTP deaminase